MRVGLLLSLAIGADIPVPGASTASVSFVKNVLKESNRDVYSAALSQEKKRRSLTEFKRRYGVYLGDETSRREEELDELSKQLACDQAFLMCLPNDNCANCFDDLYTAEIDWAKVTPDTPCDSVIATLAKGSHCTYLASDSKAKDAFCKTFTSCALWDPYDENDDDAIFYADDDAVDDGADPKKLVDCSQITKCDWDGIHNSFIGDGICHDNLPGCYNSPACRYDGGDCCGDTCNSNGYNECGSEGFWCKDPDSDYCDPVIAPFCTKTGDDNRPDDPDCAENENIYRLVMYDSFGDGWDETKLTITPTVNSNFIKFNGGLKSGSEGTEYVCLNKIPTCYNVNVSGGTWGNEISWEIKPMSPGAPAIAGGGSPMDCNFAVAGDKNCQTTCTGRADTSDTSLDPEYKDFKDMYNCINDKCIIQVGECEKIESCNSCLDDDVSDYCYGVEPFIALVDCTLCKCTERKTDSEVCATKTSPGAIPSKPEDNSQLLPSGPRPCGSSETIEGANSVRMFSQCTDMEEIGMMVSEFDQNHFGHLDSFETCAHSFAGESNHGGHTALGCMQILVNSMNGADDFDTEEEEDEDGVPIPTEAIAALSRLLYTDAPNFCTCAKEASDKCPLCRSFRNFKTLLYESLDACQALDEIDCDAWSEFSPACRKNLQSQFGTIDFTKDAQCEYVKNTCGGAGPFPAFRRLDCDGEISSTSWDFYNSFAGNCLKDLPDAVPKVTSKPDATSKPQTSAAPYATSAPKAPQTPTPQPSKKPYVPPEQGGGGSKPYVPPENSGTSGGSSGYVPPEERGKGSDSSNSAKKPYVPPEEGGRTSGYKSDSDKKSHWFRNFIFVGVIAGCASYWYKRRTETFSFIRYRRARNYMTGGGESEMYSSLAMDGGMGMSASFEPPTLPPTPDNMS